MSARLDRLAVTTGRHSHALKVAFFAVATTITIATACLVCRLLLDLAVSFDWPYVKHIAQSVDGRLVTCMAAVLGTGGVGVTLFDGPADGYSWIKRLSLVTYRSGSGRLRGVELLGSIAHDGQGN